MGVSPVLRSPPLVTVPEDFMLFNAAVSNQTQPESSPSLMGSVMLELLLSVWHLRSLLGTWRPWPLLRRRPWPYVNNIGLIQ